MEAVKNLKPVICPIGTFTDNNTHEPHRLCYGLGSQVSTSVRKGTRDRLILLI